MTGSPLKAWGLPLAVCAAVLAALEFGLRVAGFEYAHLPLGLRYVRTIASLGHERAAGDRAPAARIAYGPDPVLLWRPLPRAGVTNQDGLLGPDWPLEKAPGTLRAIALGDSCTVAGRRTYPERLEELLLRRPGPRWEVLNAGVGSWSSYQGLALLKTRLLRYRPDAVTLYFGWNDHWLAWGAPDRELSARLDRSWRVHNLIRRSRLLQALLRLATRLRGGDGPPRRGRPPRVSEEDYAANLREAVRLVRESGGKAVLVTAPTALTARHPVARYLCAESRNCDDPEDILPAHERYNEAVRRVARETGAPLADLARAFAAQPRPFRLFSDGIHLSEEGHRLAAETIAKALTGVP